MTTSTRQGPVGTETSKFWQEASLIPFFWKAETQTLALFQALSSTRRHRNVDSNGRHQPTEMFIFDAISQQPLPFASSGLLLCGN
eukprot:518745-Rhodomonas_salina.1